MTETNGMKGWPKRRLLREILQKTMDAYYLLDTVLITDDTSKAHKDIDEVQNLLDDIGGLCLGTLGQGTSRREELTKKEAPAEWLKDIKAGDIVWEKREGCISSQKVTGVTERLIFIKQPVCYDPFFLPDSPYRKYRKSDGSSDNLQKGKLVESIEKGLSETNP